MTTLVKTVCQNCFTDLNKEFVGSNFCCQQCFDEWILKQQYKLISAGTSIIFESMTEAGRLMMERK